MEKERKIKVLSVAALLVAVLGLTVAFAALSQTLTINGSATVNTASWDIHFKNLSTPTLTGNAAVTTAPTIDTKETTIGNYALKLTKPGDSVTYTFDVENKGTINAKISELVKAAKPTCTGTGAAAAADAKIICDGLTYTLTYTEGGAAVAKEDTLNANETKNLTLKLAFESNSLPADDVSISDLGITITYAQN